MKLVQGRADRERRPARVGAAAVTHQQHVVRDAHGRTAEWRKPRRIVRKPDAALRGVEEVVAGVLDQRDVERLKPCAAGKIFRPTSANKRSSISKRSASNRTRWRTALEYGEALSRRQSIGRGGVSRVRLEHHRRDHCRLRRRRRRTGSMHAI